MREILPVGTKIGWLGKRHAAKLDSSVDKGYKAEEYVSSILNENGIKHRLTNSRPHDIILENGKNIEVRSRYKTHDNCKSKNFYFFPLSEKLQNPADFIILVIDDGKEKHCFVIPFSKVKSGIGFVYPKTRKSRSNWHSYENRWDLLK